MPGKEQNIGFEMKPLEFDKFIYTREYLMKRREWYLYQVEECKKIMKAKNSRAALEFFKKFNDILKLEYHAYFLKKVQDILYEYSEEERVLSEKKYINWVQDVVINQTGRTNIKNLHQRLFDYRSYVTYHPI